MELYSRFCEETVDAQGALREFQLRYPKDFNFGYDVVDVMAREAPEQTALVWQSGEGETKRFSFAQISRRSNQIANVLLAAGIRRGDTVIVILKRHYEYWFTAAALHKIGAVLVPVTHMLTPEDYRFRLQSAKARAVICTAGDGVPEKLMRARAQMTGDCLLWSVRGRAEGFADLSEEAERASAFLPRMKTRASDPMLMYYTSGTTGNPKGVVHSFTYPLAHIITARYWQRAREGGLHFTVAETGWGKASWGKIYGQWLVGCAVMVYDFDAFTPDQLVEVINRFHVTSFCAPPTVYRSLVRRSLPPMPSLEHASTAGEAMAPEVFARFRELTGIRLRCGYGQTETVLALAEFAGTKCADGALGFPSPLFRVALRDRDGAPTPQGSCGEIVLSPAREEDRAGLMLGYLEDPAGNQAAWRGGVYHTGDAAWQDEEGRFWFQGRIDDLIKTGGYRVGPYEIETVLLKNELVEECSVIGVPDRLRGQAIKAFVVLRRGVPPTAALARRIRNECNQMLADYKWIRMVEFVKSLPKTISGKVRPFELRDR